MRRTATTIVPSHVCNKRPESARFYFEKCGGRGRVQVTRLLFGDKHFVTWRPSFPSNDFNDPPAAAMLTRLFVLALAASSAVLGSPTQLLVGGEAELAEKWSYSDCGKRVSLDLIDAEPELIQRPARFQETPPISSNSALWRFLQTLQSLARTLPSLFPVLFFRESRSGFFFLTSTLVPLTGSM